MLKTLRNSRSDIPIVVVSALSDGRSIREALDAGAMGFVPKASTTEELMNALRSVLRGNVYLPTSFVTQAGETGVATVPSLTDRQWQVLFEIVCGRTVKRIAERLGISENTVKSHVAAILRALGCSTRTQAIVWFHERGLKIPDFRG